MKAERELGYTFSRRSFVKGATGVGLLALSGAPAVINHAEQERRREYERSFRGFRGLTSAEYFELTQSFNDTNRIIKIDSIADLSNPKTVSFDLKEDGSMVFITIKGGKASNPFVQPLIVHNERQNLAPIIYGREGQETFFTGVNIGKHDKGSHQITITQDEASTYSIDEPLLVAVSVPDKDALLTTFMENTPILKLKNPSNVLDDIPLIAFSKILKKEDLYQVITSIIFSSENAGTKPRQLLDEYGRTLDVEWVIQQLYTTTGELLFNKRMYQTKNHGRSQFEGELIDNHPVLYTATQNNNFADSQTYYTNIYGRSFSNPFKKPIKRLKEVFTGHDEEEKEDVYFSPQPIFIPSDEWDEDLIERYPQFQEVSLYEVALENCVDLSDTNSLQVIRFLEELSEFRRFNNTIYPDRGCGSRKIELAA